MSMSFDRSTMSVSLVETEALLKQKEEAIANLEFNLALLRKEMERSEFAKNQEIERLKRDNELNKQTVVELTELIRVNSNSQNALDTDKAMYKLQIENTNLRREVHMLQKRSQAKPQSGRDLTEAVGPSKMQGDTSPASGTTHGKEEAPFGRSNTMFSFKAQPTGTGDKNPNPDNRQPSKSTENGGVGNAGSLILKIETQLHEEQVRSAELEKQLALCMEQLVEKQELQREHSSSMVKIDKEREKLIKELEERGKTINNLQDLVRTQKIELEELHNYRNKTSQSLMEKSSALFDFESMTKEQNTRIIELSNKYARLSERYDTETGDLQEKIVALEKRLLDSEGENERLRIQNLAQMEKLTEYLEKIERYQQARNLEIEEAREVHAKETLTLNIKINDLLKEIREAELEKQQLADQNINLKLKAGEMQDSFRVLAPLGQTDLDMELSQHKKGLRLLDDDNISYESLNLDKPGPTSASPDLLSQKPNQVNVKGPRVSERTPGLKTGVIGTLPGDDPDAGRYGGNLPLNRSKFGERQFRSTFSQAASKVSPSAVQSFRDNRANPVKVSAMGDGKNQGISAHDISQIISKNMDPENLTDLCNEMDDPLLQYIEELDEKNTEILNLKQEMHRLTQEGGVQDLRNQVVTLEIQVRSLEAQLADLEAARAKEREFSQQAYDDVCDMLIKQKMKVSAVIVEKDALWTKMSRRIKQLTYQVQIYEDLIRETNDSP